MQRLDFDIWVFDNTTSRTERVEEVSSDKMDLFHRLRRTGRSTSRRITMADSGGPTSTGLG
jgi:hypothetical protein